MISKLKYNCILLYFIISIIFIIEPFEQIFFDYCIISESTTKFIWIIVFLVILNFNLFLKINKINYLLKYKLRVDDELIQFKKYLTRFCAIRILLLSMLYIRFQQGKPCIITFLLYNNKQEITQFVISYEFILNSIVLFLIGWIIFLTLFYFDKIKHILIFFEIYLICTLLWISICVRIIFLINMETSAYYLNEGDYLLFSFLDYALTIRLIRDVDN